MNRNGANQRIEVVIGQMSRKFAETPSLDRSNVTEAWVGLPRKVTASVSVAIFIPIVPSTTVPIRSAPSVEFGSASNPAVPRREVQYL